MCGLARNRHRHDIAALADGGCEKRSVNRIGRDPEGVFFADRGGVLPRERP